MCILELFYKIEMIDSFASVEGLIYRYWSVDTKQNKAYDKVISM